MSYWKWIVDTPDQERPRRYLHLSSAIAYAAERARALAPGTVRLGEIGGWANIWVAWTDGPKISGLYTHIQRGAILAAFDEEGAPNA
ncbi:hypothetical protein SAMN06297129_2438 [Pseudooceanicola antarcticus]|uniref:Uncharacterized protein n=1 Tax=Pseudooceanicola antarcticus TaxID=1247613 RepID=A0A285IXY0_9RHOB|nr:hypothetical protein [Pseudooceanicola antarcticus]PJE25772.1 hypothetical protein CVM39_18885 [Pseudooceanicola antarcticus]SNY52905.1 hypothetical protein SAMN06297129_2438 [Pseudooceanicola antarcticus]